MKSSESFCAWMNEKVGIDEMVVSGSPNLTCDARPIHEPAIRKSQSEVNNSERNVTDDQW